ncbi:MAG: hypothetical protein KGL38_07675 [Gemmatimonadota bacterium]|nr:hypothetical protein [Gemmatimonadota bacterium]
MHRRAWMVPALLLAAALDCYKNPSGLRLEQCYINYTANLNFTNRSATNRSYDVLLDGDTVTTLAPGQTSRDFGVNAWVLHVVAFNYAGSDSAACPRQIYTPSRCETQNFVCRE